MICIKLVEFKRKSDTQKNVHNHIHTDTNTFSVQWIKCYDVYQWNDEKWKEKQD